ncbi:mitochondrial carrier domain-containing protein [Suillus occidentalis]|nr:mitochondrial carrier domain-containing protein [Suillus occidentalis]
MLGGVLACGITHAGITPLDVAKCNMQVNPTKYKGLTSGLATLIREEGQAGIWKGLGPTFVGYSLQGMFKYARYLARRLPHPLKVFADIALCPLEMTKVKIQTSPNGTFPTSFGAALAEMSRTKVETRYPFWLSCSSMIPYTMAKFCFYEKIVQLFYTHVFPEPKETYAKTTQLGPANKGKSIGAIASETGLVTLATKGLGTRVLMIGTLTGFQWWIYDSFKASMGLGTTGGK